MSHNINKLINEIKNALRQKRRTIIFNYTKTHLLFTNFILSNGYINSYKITSEKGRRLIIISLRFLSPSQISLSHFSILSKKTHTRANINTETTDFESNFLVKLTSSKNKKTEIRNRFR